MKMYIFVINELCIQGGVFIIQMFMTVPSAALYLECVAQDSYQFSYIIVVLVALYFDHIGTDFTHFGLSEM